MRVSLLIILLIFSENVFSIPPAFGTPITVIDGLSDNRVYAMDQDERGFLWIATANGLNRYDGHHFTIFNSNNSSLLNNTIHEIKKGPPYHLLLATRFGAVLLDTRTGIMKNYIVPSIPELQPIVNDVRHVEFTSKNEIVLGTEGGIYVFDLEGNLLANQEANFDITDIGIKRMYYTRDIASFSNGDIFAATLNGFYYYKSNEKRIVPVNQLPSEFEVLKHFLNKHRESYVFEINRQDQLFFVDHIKLIDSIYILDVKANMQYSHPLPFSTADNIRWDSKIQFHDDTLVTITTARQGFFIYSFKHHIKTFELISGNHAKNMLCKYVLLDKGKNYWIGTETGVLQEQKKINAIRNINILPFVESGEYHPVTAVYPTQEKIWIGSYSNTSGLIVLNKEFNFLKRIDLVQNSSTKNHILTISPWSADSLLIGTKEMPFLINVHDYNYTPLTLKNSRTPVDKIRITEYFETSDNGSWISEGQSRGVWHISKERESIKFYKPGKSRFDFPLRNAGAFAEDKKGNIWMVHYMDGLTRWNHEKKIFDTVVRKWPDKNINRFDCSGIVIDDNNIFWFFINSYGLVKYDPQKNTFKRVVATSDRVDDNVSGLFLTHDKYIWMNLRHSILVFNTESGALVSLSQKNGLPAQSNSSQQINYNPYTNNMLIGFTNHISVIPFDIYAKVDNTQQFYITGIKELNDGVFIDINKPISLPYNKNNLRIDFSLVDFENALSQPYFEYRLTEYENWNNIGSQTSLNLNNLPPGEYDLQIRTSGLYTDNSIKQASLSIIIKPAFYQTIWFYAGIALLLFTLFYTFYRYRIHQIKKIHQIREKIASDLHDDIGSRLTNISVLSVISEDEKVPVTDRKRYLKKISEEALASGEALDEIVRNMHKHDEELADISARMRRYAGEIFENGQPAFTMQIDNDLSHRHMDLEKKRDLFLAFKEILNNIQKHANANNIHIAIYAKPKDLILNIRDDGNGFNPGEYTSRNGIKNIKSRIGHWGGDVKIISGKNAGTEVQIQLPF